MCKRRNVRRTNELTQAEKSTHPFCCLLHLNSLIAVSMWRGDNEGWLMLLHLSFPQFILRKAMAAMGGVSSHQCH